MMIAFPFASFGSHSWGGYHWARTANPFTLKLGDNVSSGWDTYLAMASIDWSQSTDWTRLLSQVELILKTAVQRLGVSRCVIQPTATKAGWESPKSGSLAEPTLRKVPKAKRYLLQYADLQRVGLATICSVPRNRSHLRAGSSG
jgi:hypothetical protein